MRTLAPAEVDVLRLRAEGLRRRQIAEFRGCAEGTVKALLNRATVKLRARNTVHAVAIAIREGWM